MRTKIAIVLAWLLGTFFVATPLEAADPTAAGLWEQIDDDGHVGGWFLIFQRNGIYEGAIVKMFPRPAKIRIRSARDARATRRTCRRSASP